MKKSGQTKSVLILGNYRTTLTVAESLKKAGFNVIVSDADDGAAGARYSRFVDEMWAHPPLNAQGGAPFQDALTAFLEARSDITTIFPVLEGFVVWLAANMGQFPPHLTIVSPESRLVELCLDKMKMLELASRAGVECAPYAVAGTLEELLERSDEVGYPVIIRPFSQLIRLGHKKAVICSDRADLAAQFPAWPARQSGLLLQHYVSGVRHDLYFIAIEGEIVSLLETRIIRTDHLDGTGLSTEGVHVPVTNALAHDTRRLVREVGYTGIGFTQFIRDSQSGEATFLELNPRTAGSHRCAEAVGMPLTWAALELARGNTDLGLDPAHRYRAGVRYAWATGDLYGLKEALAHGETGLAGAAKWLWRAALSLVTARIHLTFSWRDPLPAIALLIRQSVRALAPARVDLRSEGGAIARPALQRSGLTKTGSSMGSR